MANLLFICGGNTCRSPMAKVILEQLLKGKGHTGKLLVESAAYDDPTLPTASDNARKAMKQLFGADLLASYRAKRLDSKLVAWADLVLVMAGRMKKGLPTVKTRTLKEYAGETGDISDPWGKGAEVYVKCAGEIRDCLVASWSTLTREFGL